MCDLWDLQCQAGETAAGITGVVVGNLVAHLTAMISDALSALIVATTTWWLHLPTTDVGTSPTARTLQEWMLPFAALVAVGGMLWQSLLMIINRKGEPLLTIVKGLFATAVWGAVAITGTQLLLDACQNYTEWVLTSGLGCDPGIGQDTGCKTDALAERLTLLLAPAPGLASILALVGGFLVLIAGLVQAVLLLFRNGAIIILAGLLQLAAAGTFTASTSNWLRRVLGWLLALVFYQPFAATCYAVAFMLIGDRDNTDVGTWLTGVRAAQNPSPSESDRRANLWSGHAKNCLTVDGAGGQRHFDQGGDIDARPAQNLLHLPDAEPVQLAVGVHNAVATRTGASTAHDLHPPMPIRRLHRPGDHAEQR